MIKVLITALFLPLTTFACEPIITLEDTIYVKEFIYVYFKNKGHCHIEQTIDLKITVNGASIPLKYQTLHTLPKAGKIHRAKYPLFYFNLNPNTFALIKTSIEINQETRSSMKKWIYLSDENKRGDISVSKARR